MLTKVIFPYITPGIFAGFFMALTYSLDDFAVTFFVTGNGFSTLSVEIYSMARQGVSLDINALSTLLFLFTMLLVIGYYFINQRNKAQPEWGDENDEKTYSGVFSYFCCFILLIVLGYQVEFLRRLFGW